MNKLDKLGIIIGKYYREVIIFDSLFPDFQTNYHIYNWNDFQDYLLNHTKIDLPDSSPHRCDYGRVLTAEEVEETDGSFMKLNFQIRSS